jgi:hypothetical protein
MYPDFTNDSRSMIVVCAVRVLLRDVVVGSGLGEVKTTTCVGEATALCASVDAQTAMAKIGIYSRPKRFISALIPAG